MGTFFGKIIKASISLVTVATSLSGCSKEYQRSEALELFTFSSELIRPIEEGEKKHLNGSIIYNGEEVISKAKVLAKISYFKDDEEYLFAQVSASNTYFNLSKNDVINYDFDVTDSEIYAKYKMLIKLCVYNMASKELLDERDLYLYTITHEEINPDDYRYSSLILNKLTYQDGNEFKEEYQFDGIKNINNLPYYYRLDASVFSFNYYSDIPFTLDNAYLTFIDQDNLFPHLIENDGYKILPLLYKEEEGVISFYFDTLYVSKVDLDMSSYQVEDYYRTHYLYFPRNKYTNIQGYSFYINLENMGANGIAVHHEVMLNTSRPLLGPCNEAVYCVVGGKA